MPKVSVVVPCYNQGQFIDEAIDSVLEQTFQDFEIIIVNDGSTDSLTNKILKNYKKPKTKVITTINQGLPSARNEAIKAARGEYILPLDADDKINKEYIEKCVTILDEDSSIGIVYPKFEFFDAKTGISDLPDYSFPEILLTNFMVCTSMFRRSDWEKVGGYKKNMKFGFEDLEFWLSIIELERKVVKASEEVMFYYRKRSANVDTPHSSADSISSSTKLMYSLDMLVENHPKLYAENSKFLVHKIMEEQIRKETLRLKMIELQKENQILEESHSLAKSLKKLFRKIFR